MTKPPSTGRWDPSDVLDDSAATEAPGFLRRHWRLALEIGGASSRSEAIAMVVQAAFAVEEIDAVSFFVADPKTAGLVLAAHAGLPDSYVAGIASLGSTHPRVELARAGLPVFTTLGDAQDGAEGLGRLLPEAPELGLRAYAMVPIFYQGELVALLDAASRRVADLSLGARADILALAAPVGETLKRFGVQEALEESERRYKALLRQLTEAVLVVEPESLLLQEVNERALALLDYPEDEIVGISLDRIVEGDAETLRDEVRRSLAAGSLFLGERRCRTSGGGLVEAEISAGRVRLGSGDVVLVSIHDLTPRRQAEQALARARDHNELLLASAGEGIVGLDRGGRLTFANPAATRLLGHEAADILGLSEHDLFHRERRDGTSYPVDDCPIAATCRDGVPRRAARELFFRADGSGFLVEYAVTPIREDGHLRGAVVVFRDVTKEERLESIAASLETMRSIGYVFSAVRHELANPVNSIKTALSVLLHGLERFPPDVQRRSLERCLAELARVEDLVVSLRSISLYEELQPVPTDLPALVSQLATLASADFAAKGIAVETSFPPGVPAAHADPRALRQVLLNLLANAADATAGTTHPRIVLETFATGGLVGIRVKDNGPGMTEEVARGLFQPFHTTKPTGTGLGLFLAKKAMARMEGTIEVVSRTREGTTVVLTFRPEGGPATPPEGTARPG